MSVAVKVVESTGEVRPSSLCSPRRGQFQRVLAERFRVELLLF